MKPLTLLVLLVSLSGVQAVLGQQRIPDHSPAVKLTGCSGSKACDPVRGTGDSKGVPILPTGSRLFIAQLEKSRIDLNMLLRWEPTLPKLGALDNLTFSITADKTEVFRASGCSGCKSYEGATSYDYRLTDKAVEAMRPFFKGSNTLTIKASVAGGKNPDGKFTILPAPAPLSK